MRKATEKFIVNGRGRRTGVILDIAEYVELRHALEELESIRAYDTAKESGDEVISFEQATEEIERERQ